MKACLHLYFGKIKVHRLENVPKDKPVLFLSNHQNALLDVLLIGSDCNRHPWFLTRSDVFKSKLIKPVFKVLRMIPIYRIRDGRDSLKNNQAVFDRCSDLLIKGEAILMFPEANHNLKRRVRPLSKGFIRILFNALEKAAETDIHIVPVGLNYRNALKFPDRVALYFDTPISVKEFYNTQDEKGSVKQLKNKVSSRLKDLTTHIEDEASYNKTIAKLDAFGVDYLNPKKVNEALRNLSASGGASKKETNFFAGLVKGFFTLLNLPVLLLWKIFVKSTVREDEFISTFRFGFSLLIYPIYYGVVFTIISQVWTPILGLGTVFGLFGINRLLARLD